MRSARYIAFAAVVIASPASAQAPDPIKLEVPRAHLQIIGQGLMELPYKTSAPVLSELQSQLSAADAAAARAKAEEKAKADGAAKARAEEKPAQ